LIACLSVATGRAAADEPSPLLPSMSSLFAPDAAPRKDTRTEYPRFLADSYVTLSVGSINYPFSNFQLEPGNRVDRISVPHAAVRLVLIGHRFHKYLSGQVSYMRPGRFVTYHNVNGTGIDRSVWIAVGEITLKSQLPLTKQLELYGEFGVSNTTRKGFSVNNVKVVDNTHVASLVIASGFEYHVDNNWDLLAGISYAGAHARHRQPETVFTSLGVRYNMRPPNADGAGPRVAEASPYIFPEYTAQLGFSTKQFGYTLNRTFSRQVPIFWGGEVEAANGIHARLQRNVFHTRKVFSLDLGVSAGVWKSYRDGDQFAAFSAYPLFRFTFARTPLADFYASYSVAGPTLMTKARIDRRDLGTYFTFQDLLGAGVYFGKRRNLVAELGIGHFSYGNLFAEYPGTKIPLTFNLGVAF
jgi:hypothetical protein